MLQRISSWFRRLMYGRYGVDRLNIALLISGMILCLVSNISPLGFFYYLAYLPLLFSLFRMFSKNLEARRAENAWLEAMLRRLRDHSHRYFKCPNCRQTVRVPKGKGKINIRCPKCGESFLKKT